MGLPDKTDCFAISSLGPDYAPGPVALLFVREKQQ